MNGYYKINICNSTNKYIVVITKHANKRFAERFANNSTENQEHNILDLFKESEETSSFLNKSDLIQYFYDTYGYKRKYFYIYKNSVLFVCDKNDNTIYILTCMQPPLWSLKPQKYRKKVSC
jgi:hypothetical protein